MPDDAMTPTTYLHNELKFKLKEFMNLSDEDKNDLRRWAVEEMTILGIPIKV